jgi:hypothetical protein
LERVLGLLFRFLHLLELGVLEAAAAIGEATNDVASPEVAVATTTSLELVSTCVEKVELVVDVSVADSVDVDELASVVALEVPLFPSQKVMRRLTFSV